MSEVIPNSSRENERSGVARPDPLLEAISWPSDVANCVIFQLPRTGAKKRARWSRIKRTTRHWWRHGRAPTRLRTIIGRIGCIIPLMILRLRQRRILLLEREILRQLNAALSASERERYYVSSILSLKRKEGNLHRLRVLFRSRRSRGFNHRTVLVHLGRIDGRLNRALHHLGFGPKVYVPRSEEGLAKVCTYDNQHRIIAGTDTLAGIKAALKSRTQTQS